VKKKKEPNKGEKEGRILLLGGRRLIGQEKMSRGETLLRSWRKELRGGRKILIPPKGGNVQSRRWKDPLLPLAEGGGKTNHEGEVCQGN